MRTHELWWPSFNGRTADCGSANEGSIPSGHPNQGFLSDMKKWSLLILILAFLLAVFSAIFYYWPTIQNKLLSLNEVQYASGYQITQLTCSLKEDCGEISFTFNNLEVAASQTPSYQIKEMPEEAKTEIIFNDVQETSNNFTYEQINANPLVEDVSHEQIGNAFVLTIKRKGPLTPTQVQTNANTVILKFPFGTAQYPKFSEVTPQDQSSINNASAKISAKAALNSELKQAIMYLDDIKVDLQIKNLGFNQYSFEANQNLQYGSNYNTKLIAIDSQNRATAITWDFGVQKSQATAILGEDRFKYIGWWGQINSTTTPVMSAPSSTSTQLAIFSTINRVKVLKEVTGETIGGSDLWLQIDGGAHPGTYIFSGYVTPIEQPKPPSSFNIPQGVKENEYWIDVDITKKVFTLFLYNQPVFATYVATGLPASPTLTGTYNIWYKLVKTRMRGGPPVATHFYDLPNVPYVMYYNGSFAIHGTYWHDKFGTRQSAGCTNLTQGDAKFIFEKTNPVLPADKNFTLSTADNPGTTVYNHY